MKDVIDQAVRDHRAMNLGRDASWSRQEENPQEHAGYPGENGIQSRSKPTWVKRLLP